MISRRQVDARGSGARSAWFTAQAGPALHFMKMLSGDPLQRELLDGRTLILYPQIYNYLLTVSSPESLRLGVYDDGW